MQVREDSPVGSASTPMPSPAGLNSQPSDAQVSRGDLFAMLARRGAALVDRQHEVLEALQVREEDPERLASLFRLDHLAAQLRRNTNATLALAGLPTNRGIQSSTLLSELVHAAVSEINGYQRVSMGAFPTGRVKAPVASDLVHLLGDLLEVALAVSPRAGGVWVRGERPGSRATDTTAAVRIGDSGAAVSDAELDALNDLLAGRTTRVGGGRDIGLVMSGELAKRHHLTVCYRRLISGGLVATVTLPRSVFDCAGEASHKSPQTPPRATTEH